MRFVKRNQREVTPEISFVLMDWGCRETFHTLEYLNNQTERRDRYEIIWIEYYDRKPARIAQMLEDYKRCGLPDPVDTWIILERPKGEIFRKHWINNIGTLEAKGKIVCFMDSDAITSTTLVHTILKEFENIPDLILYIEEIRTADKSFYPFNYPNHKEIIPGAVNMKNGVPVAMRNFRSGLLADPSLIHCRNYGACFSARKEDLIRIGGWDEHEDYTGYIAGPYEMSLRMELAGKKELWSHFELLYHTPHPGNSGIDNYSGPHDGRGVSSTAMKILETKRLFPLEENPGIKALRLKMPAMKLSGKAVIGKDDDSLNNNLMPTTPEKSGFSYLPPASVTGWDKKTVYLLAKFYEELEIRTLDYGYSRPRAIGSYAAALAKKIGLPQEKAEAIYVAGFFCDMSKMLASSSEKSQSSLDFAGIFESIGEEPASTIKKVTANYKEHFDGNGPKRLKGTAIPVEARIVAFALHFDKLINQRDGVGRAASFSEALNSIELHAGKELAPDIVDAFMDIKEDFVCIHLKNKHGLLNFMYPCYNFDDTAAFGASAKAAASIAVVEGAGHIKDTFMDFNIFRIEQNNREVFYAIPASEGNFSMDAFKENKYSFSYAGKSIDEVKSYLNATLILQGLYGHNVIFAAGRYFAINQCESVFSITKAVTGQYDTASYVSVNLRMLKQKVLIGRVKEHLRNKMKILVKKFLPA
ncbi:MAG: HD domain-containing phosphohydrolase [Thermodesulfobacteriota bacterium]